MAYAAVEELAGLLQDPVTDSHADGRDGTLLGGGGNGDRLGARLHRPIPAPDPPPPLVVEVNLERAVEHWRQSYSPFGVVGVGAESEPIVAARNSWYRHHLKLAPLREHAGIA